MSSLNDADRPSTRGTWAASRLRTAILTGELKSGEKLSPHRLASELEVSPTPLREALNHLSSEGLVVMTPQRGARVSQTSPRQAKELYELRMLLEPIALEDSVSRFSDADRAAVTACFEEYAQLWAEATRVTSELYESHKRFHDATLCRCSSEQLSALVSDLTLHSMRYTDWLGRRNRVKEHAAICEAVQAGDVHGAADAVREHLQPGLRWAREQLRAGGDSADLVGGLEALIDLNRARLLNLD